MLTDMPVGCQGSKIGYYEFSMSLTNHLVPISDSSSGVYLYQPVNGSTRIDPEDATDGHLNPASLARSSPAALTSNTPASTSDQPRASSPLLPYHYNPVKRDGTYQGDAGNRRISDIGNESNFESLDLVHSSKGIKKLIGPWNLGTTLGEGATGRVRKARHIITGQVAAVKIMSKRVATVMRSQSVLQMDNKIASRAQLTSNFGLPFGLEREIVIMKLIIHPNITKLYDLWENRGEM